MTLMIQGLVHSYNRSQRSQAIALSMKVKIQSESKNEKNAMMVYRCNAERPEKVEVGCEGSVESSNFDSVESLHHQFAKKTETACQQSLFLLVIAVRWSLT